MSVAQKASWEESGHVPMSRAQQKLLNAACQDLSDNVRWHGVVLSKDDWRHVLSATILGDRLIPGINMGEGAPGLIRLPRSSLELTKTQATKAIHTAFEIGDHPADQGLDIPPIRWGPLVTLARFVTEDEP